MGRTVFMAGLLLAGVATASVAATPAEIDAGFKRDDRRRHGPGG